MLKDTRKHRLAGVLIWLFIFLGLGYQIPNRMLPVELTVTATEPGILSVWVLDDSQVVWKNSGFVEESSDDSAVPHLISSQELAQITIRLPAHELARDVFGRNRARSRVSAIRVHQSDDRF